MERKVGEKTVKLPGINSRPRPCLYRKHQLSRLCAYTTVHHVDTERSEAVETKYRSVIIIISSSSSISYNTKMPIYSHAPLACHHSTDSVDKQDTLGLTNRWTLNINTHTQRERERERQLHLIFRPHPWVWSSSISVISVSRTANDYFIFSHREYGHSISLRQHQRQLVEGNGRSES